ncbi:MAG TPA: SPOR domain-containing protein, partial [Hyphomicrobiaceae bacterium]|nr:SPOR domain-containing protein [Hyphomicrobiaceae bacterium]
NALVVKSANDVATAVAEHIAGSEGRFARLMTQKARELGMRATRFENASGLPDSDQVTTARDMAKLALHLLDDFPQYYGLFSQKSFRFRGRTYRSHNGLVKRFAGTDGIKTGYTRASGFNLVSSVRRGRRHVVGVVFGGRSAGSRDARMRSIIKAALPRAESRQTRELLRPQLVAKRRPAHRRRIAAAQPLPAKSPPREASAIPIHIARVRPIDVRVRRGHAQRFTAIAQQRAQRRAPRPAARPATLPVRTDGRATSAAADRAAPVLRTAPVPATPPRGYVRQPSSLQAQAARLAAGRRAAPWQAPQSSLGGNPSARQYEVQVGAYRSEAEARLRLNALRRELVPLLRDAQPETSLLPQARRPIYRARFVGFDSRMAAQTCLEMRRRQIDCFVAAAN